MKTFLTAILIMGSLSLSAKTGTIPAVDIEELEGVYSCKVCDRCARANYQIVIVGSKISFDFFEKNIYLSFTKEGFQEAVNNLENYQTIRPGTICGTAVLSEQVDNQKNSIEYQVCYKESDNSYYSGYFSVSTKRKGRFRKTVDCVMISRH